MKNRRKLRHIRTVLLSLTTVGLFCLCVWLFYQGLFEQDGAVPLPVAESSSRPTLEISSAEPSSTASSAESQGGAAAPLGEPLPMASSTSPVSEPAAASSDPAAVSSSPASAQASAPAGEAPASSAPAAPASSAAPTASLP